MPIGIVMFLGILALAATILEIIFLIESPSDAIVGLISVIMIDTIVPFNIYKNNIEVYHYDVVSVNSITVDVSEGEYQYYKVEYYARNTNLVYTVEFNIDETVPKVGDSIDLNYHDFKKKFNIVDEKRVSPN